LDRATKLAIRKPLFSRVADGIRTRYLRYHKPASSRGTTPAFCTAATGNPQIRAISAPSSFVTSASFMAKKAEKGTDLRNPQTDFSDSSPLPLLVQMPVQQANPPPRHPTSVRAAASRGSETGVRALMGPGSISRINLVDAEDFRRRWLFVFLLQQRSPSDPCPCSQGRG
jgi:hypothetical protein